MSCIREGENFPDQETKKVFCLVAKKNVKSLQASIFLTRNNPCKILTPIKVIVKNVKKCINIKN